MKTIILFFICITGFAQIGSKVAGSNPSLVGNWLNNSFGFDMKLTLGENGKGVFDEENISYTINTNKLIIKFDEETISYNFKLAGSKLTLSGGDLDQAIDFNKSGVSTTSPKINANTTTNSSTTKSTDNTTASKVDRLIGQWTTQGADIEFKPGGKGIYNGNPFNYTVSGNTLTTSDNTGSNTFFYMFLGQGLSLNGAGINVVLQKGHGGYKAELAQSNEGSNNSGYANSGNSAGGIDQSLVGKWCWVNSSNNYQSSSSSSKCLVINGNGTYTYNYEGSISGYGGGGYGGSSSQNSDSGTWKVVGNKLHVQSRSQGFKIYTLEKRNHPKNRDPMIIIDGDAYVTYYQKSSW